MLGFPITLQELERRSPLFVQCSNLAVDGEAFSLQRFEGIDEDWIIVVEALPVARNQPDLGLHPPVPIYYHHLYPTTPACITLHHLYLILNVRHIRLTYT